MDDGNISSSTLTASLDDINITLIYRQLIEKLNYDRMIFQLPVTITLFLIMVVSILGNILVFCVYRMTCKSSVASFFITFLAGVDLISGLSIPFNIHDMLNPYMDAAPVACKIGRFLESFMAVLSGNLLVCIAFDRYFHIIYPLRQYTFQQARSLAIVLTAVALCVTWPQLFLAGKRTVETPIEGIFGEDCSFQDGMHNSIYTLLFQGVLALSYLIGFCVSLIFYSRIYIVICRRRWNTIGENMTNNNKTAREKKSIIRLCKFKLKDRFSTKRTSITDVSFVTITEVSETNTETASGRRSRLNVDDVTQVVDTDSNNSTKSSTGKEKVLVDGDYSLKTSNSSTKSSTGKGRIHLDEDHSIKTSNSSTKSSTGKGRIPLGGDHSLKTSKVSSTKCTGSGRVSSKNSHRKSSSRTRSQTAQFTRIMAIVTLAGLFSFIPYLIVNIFKNMGILFRPGMSKTEDLVYEFCTKSYYLNSFVNPVIYSVMNPIFRSDAWKTVKKMCTICCSKQSH